MRLHSTASTSSSTPSSSSTPMTRQSLFVYGTLMAPRVIETLLGRLPANQSARLYGYVRHPVKQRMYPGMIRTTSVSSTGSANDEADSHLSSLSTTGILFTDLTPREMNRLDLFEDVEYTRQQVTVSILAEKEKGKEEVSTQTYLWTNPLSELDLTHEWSFENFCQKNLETYLIQTVWPCRQECDRLPDCRLE